MKNKVQSKKEPWIPPPAKSSRSPKKEKKKSQFDPTVINIDFKPKVDDEKFHWQDSQLHPTRDAVQLQMRKANDKLEILEIAQRLSFEKSRLRLEELQEIMQDDDFGENNEYENEKNPETSNMNQVNINDVEEQTQNLVYKLRDFEANSTMLRNLLKDTKNVSSAEIPNKPWEEANRAPFIAKHELKASENEDVECQTTSVFNQKCDLHDKKIEILEDTVKNLQLENQKLFNIKKTQDDTRAQMQRELHRQEANLNRLKVQMKTPDKEVFTQDHISQKDREIELLKTSFTAEKETWKKVLKLEKKKSAKNAEIIENLRFKILAKVMYINGTSTF
ncbi:hypothetical protein GQR58_002433 [Nymphon striatum]|nr:hypothetical protein GQR58_002433 [Nymphon striatum]